MKWQWMPYNGKCSELLFHAEEWGYFCDFSEPSFRMGLESLASTQVAQACDTKKAVQCISSTFGGVSILKF